jgi:hypothetical protein
MDSKTFMSLIKVETLLTQFPTNLIWKKYVMNVNMTQIEYNPVNLTNNKSLIYDCAFDQFQKMEGFITTAVDKNLVSFIDLLCKMINLTMEQLVFDLKG